MTDRTLKDKITASTITLFVTLMLTVLLWTLTGMYSIQNWMGLGFTILVMSSLRHMSNGNALMRTRTWMVPSTYLLLTGVILPLHHFQYLQCGLVFYCLSQYYLFQAYQENHAERFIFVAFLFLGASSFFFAPIVFMALPFMISMIVQLRAFFFRSILAALFGLIAALEVYVSSLFLLDKMALFYDYIEQLTTFSSLSLPCWSIQYEVNLGFAAFLFLIACLHYARTNFNDKIRTRMLFYVIMLQNCSLFILLALQTQHCNALLPIIVLESSPLIGHYLVYSRGKVAQFFFVLILLLASAVALFNLWAS